MLDEIKTEVPIFRFNFSEEFNKELGYFAKLHKHEDRIDFKENWQEWVNDNNQGFKMGGCKSGCLSYPVDPHRNLSQHESYLVEECLNNGFGTNK